MERVARYRDRILLWERSSIIRMVDGIEGIRWSGICKMGEVHGGCSGIERM